MFSRILVGIDDETRGRDAVALARKLGSRGTEFIFAHVYPAVPAATALFDEEQVKQAYRLLAAVVAESGLRADVRFTGSASVGAGLCALADDTEADLLVVGVTGRSRVVRALLGNPTAGTLTRAGCLVAVAPEGYAEADAEIRKVAVAYDGTGASDSALDFACELAGSTNAALSTFEVVGHATPSRFPTLRRWHKRSAQAALADECMAEQGERIFVQHLSFGDPVEELGNYSRAVDLLIAGARGAGRVARFPHPSTTVALTDVIRCPLLVLPGSGDQAAVSDRSSANASCV